MEAGLWEAKERKQPHRRRRERRRAFGEMVLMDTSIHAWLEERSREEIVLIAMIDDATSRLCARFFRRDTGAANRHMLVDYLGRFGRMGALYTDRASHFQAHFNRSKRAAADTDEALTLIQRALTALDVALILALSPQAKGRVERLFGTLQDRLIEEMRVAGIGSMEQANRFLEETFLPFWNERFTVEPSEAAGAHRPLEAGTDLLGLFAATEERVIRSDFTFCFKRRHFQIQESEADGAMPKSRLTIEERLDGTTRYRWRGRYLCPAPLAEGRAREVAAPPEVETEKAPRPLSGAAGKPVPASHPWRRFPVLVGKARRASPVAASAAAPLRPDTPSRGTADPSP